MRVIVVGGGAAGFFGAIAAAQANPQAQVTILEAGQQPLSKVRISGGGRCNVTHACFDPALLVQHYPRGGKALRGAFSRFQPQDTVAWFRRHGVTLKREADGRMFPTTDSSETIVDCLMQTARRLGIRVQLATPVVSVTSLSPGFRLTLKSGAVADCDRLLLATGSSPQGHRLAASLGHTIEPPVPSLFTFTIRDAALRSLAGVAVETADLDLQFPSGKPLRQSGPLLITHWGMSGPAILKLSAWGARSLHDAHYQAQLRVNWLPGSNLEHMRSLLLAVKSDYPKRAIANHCPVAVPRRLWHYLVERSQIAAERRWADLSKAEALRLAQELTQGHYAIAGKGVFKDEFVTCGGVRLREVTFKTMESRQSEGLFLAGEVLDIDGVTGGFNFQSAWTTAWIAGQAIASS
ncbi:MAG: NAD(P)/FAD-dependent oxidoreductase [Elainellaceae cyanobacterium]